MATRVINDDPRCQSQNDCRRRKPGDGLCRPCAQASGIFSAVSKRPEVRAKKDWLSPEQIAEVAAAMAAGRNVEDVAADYLISRSRVYQIANAAGIYRRAQRDSAGVYRQSQGA